MAVPLCGDDLVTNLSMPNSRFRFKKKYFSILLHYYPQCICCCRTTFLVFETDRQTDRLFAEPALKNRKNARCVFTETFPGFPLFKAVQGLRSVFQLLYWEFIKCCPSIKTQTAAIWYKNLMNYPCCLVMGLKNAPSIIFGSSSVQRYYTIHVLLLKK